MTDLGMLEGARRSSANVISAKGQIVGFSKMANDALRETLWTPHSVVSHP